jgi:hypothetical protein
MALTLGDNFSYQGAKPLDARLKYDTLAAMKAVGDATMYDGCMAYCVATDKIYQWKSSNTVDPDTGKWREFSSGGGHTIEDAEGTDLTQRDTLQFGEGFKAEDDDTNKKTVITPDVMPSEDMSEVISPLPSVQPRYHKYSTEEHIVGEWIDGKTLYEKTFPKAEILPTTDDRTWVDIADLSSLNTVGIINVDYIIEVYDRTFTNFYFIIHSDTWQDYNGSFLGCAVNTDKLKVLLYKQLSQGNAYKIRATVRYTKSE